MLKHLSKVFLILSVFFVLITPASTRSSDGHRVAVKATEHSSFEQKKSSLPKGSISAMPEALEAAVSIGETTTATLILNNSGTEDIAFSLHEVGDSSSILRAAGGKKATRTLRQSRSRRALVAQEQEASSAPLTSWPSYLLGVYGIAYTNFDDNGTSDDNGTIWVSSDGDNSTSVAPFDITGTQVDVPYTAPSAAGSILDLACNWNNGNLWVMSGSDSTSCIYEVNPSRGFTTRQAICPPGLISQRGLAYDPVTGTFFSGGFGDTMIHQFRPNGTQVKEPVNVGLAMTGLAYNPQTGHLFVMSEDATTQEAGIHVLDTHDGYRDLRQIALPDEFSSGGGGGLEIDCDGDLWAVDKITGMVYRLESDEQTNVCSLDVPWLSESQTSGSIPAGDSVSITVVFDASVNAITQVGAYTAQLKVKTTGNSDSFIPITMNVVEPNTPPVLTRIGNKSVNELNRLKFIVAATDSDLPANTLTFSLDAGAPEGALINPRTGIFVWDPTETHGPGSFQVTVRVTDNGTPALSDSETITITVREVNSAPVLSPIGNKSVDELDRLKFTAAATDPDMPATVLTFMLGADAPQGAVIDPQTGGFTWTPTEAQGPGSYPVTVLVMDNGTPSLNTWETITITVNEVNKEPVLSSIGNKTVNELDELTFTASATDPDSNALTFSLGAGAPQGAHMTPAGVFTWTPTEAQGPESYPVTVTVTDNGTPALSASETITITVRETNGRPALTPIRNKTVTEREELTFRATANDSDRPTNTLTFSLGAGAPQGARITPAGVFTWTPTEAQGGASYPVTVIVTDNGTPALTDSETINIRVDKGNSKPVLTPIGNKTVTERKELTFRATANDSDRPTNTLTFSLGAGAPQGARITPAGVFTWTPTEAQGPDSCTVTVIVTDDGTPALRESEKVTITVREANSKPVLASIEDQTVTELHDLTFRATATDSDLPSNRLTFSLGADAPQGASINAQTGVFSFTPSEAQGSESYLVTILVTDDGHPALSDLQRFKITVNEGNSRPVLRPIGNKTVNEQEELMFRVTAKDSDRPHNRLTFSLDEGAPAGATITPAGVFSWTPTEAQGPENYQVTVRVADNGNPALSDSETLRITVNEVNKEPVLAHIGNKTVNEQEELTFRATVNDSDLPANRLTFSLDEGAPAGATITPAGVFSWTPTEAQGPENYQVTVRVADNGNPALSDSQTFRITVNEVNKKPVLNIGHKAVNEGEELTFSAAATDSDLPANKLTFSLDAGAPAGATLTPAGVFSWTPTEAQGPENYQVTVRVTDNGNPALSNSETVTITVKEVNTAPGLHVYVSEASWRELTPIQWVNSSSADLDRPRNRLTYSLGAGAPAGAGIDPQTGTLIWTPTEAQGPGEYPITVIVTDDGTPPLSDSETVTVRVREVNKRPVLTPIGNKSVGLGEELTFTATATDSDLPANTLTFNLNSDAPAGAVINAETGVFTWTPTQAGTYKVRVTVWDNYVDPAWPSALPGSDTEEITITVNGPNQAPQLAPIGNRAVDELTRLTFTATATDADRPSNTLTFSLGAGAPAGTAINSQTGLFTWTPTEAQGPGSYPVTVHVTDNGTPALSDSETITITVNEVNTAPVAVNKTLTTRRGMALTGKMNAADADGNPLVYSFVKTPKNGSVVLNNKNTGSFTYTPKAGFVGTDSFNFRASDRRTYSNIATVTITVRR